MVCGSVLDTSDLQMMLEEKESLDVRSGDLGGIPLFPSAQFIQSVWLLASEMRWCSIVLKVNPTSYCEWVYIHVRLQQAIQQLEVPSGAHCP